MPMRSRYELTKTNCSIADCPMATFEIPQYLCEACNKYSCFLCVAIKRRVCCAGYKKRFWPGLMWKEVADVKAAIAKSDNEALAAALDNFGIGATDQRILEEMGRW